MKFTDTIAAISTPPGTGAIALIRLSGPSSINILSVLFTRNGNPIDLSGVHHSVAMFGEIHDDGVVLDEVIVTVFRSPRSYTGEDVVEVSCHGSVFIQDRLLQLLLDGGARMADPGEFTLRAFVNGRMDLTQAEGVADLIASGSRRQHHLAMQQMRGGISAKLKVLRARLVELAALLELELDFSQEDVEFADRNALMTLLGEIMEEMEPLMKSFRLGNSIKRGIPVTIAGSPNAGKSTLLNALLQEEKAIVSEIPGTTRDAIEDTMIIGDLPFRFIDTAGLRANTPDPIEALGMEKTLDKITRAAVVLYIFDASSTTIDEVKSELAHLFRQLNELMDETELEKKQFILVANKIDQLMEIPHHFSEYMEMEVVFISAKRHENLDGLKDALMKNLEADHLLEQLVITNTRHYEALSKSMEALSEAMDALRQHIPADLVAVDIRKALYYIGVITGEVTTHEMLGNIFGRFCIGK
jgi:tRNA modification GTPase